MTFSLELLSMLCHNFCEEIETITHETEYFLAQFHTEDRFRFSDVEQIKKNYLDPYGHLVTSLLASLKRSDNLALTLSALLASTDCADAIAHMPRVEALWNAYEQYHSQISNYLDRSARYWTDKAIMTSMGTAPLVEATRILIAAQRQTSTAFSQEQSKEVYDE